MKVLIAEDEQTIANGIAAILKTREEFHCQIRFAENGLDALEEASVLKDIALMPARVKCAVLGWHTMEELIG